MRARDIMTKDPVCLRRDDTARRAAEVMRDSDCGVIPIVDDNRRVIGIITDRDLAIRGVAAGKSADVKIGEVMTLADSMRENNPVNLDPRLAQVSTGVIRLDSQLLVVLDIDRVLLVSAQIKAA